MLLLRDLAVSSLRSGARFGAPPATIFPAAPTLRTVSLEKSFNPSSIVLPWTQDNAHRGFASRLRMHGRVASHHAARDQPNVPPFLHLESLPLKGGEDGTTDSEQDTLPATIEPLALKCLTINAVSFDDEDPLSALASLLWRSNFSLKALRVNGGRIIEDEYRTILGDIPIVVVAPVFVEYGGWPTPRSGR
ncbi:hypothetical protein C8J57DRAFT_1679333 [Mycena rebaudengoi]|nr:hypothetical protein C8J57DRAFT_1679333 [Mycena rebaudengoi]